MSVHPDRKAWRVRYRDTSGRQRSRTFARKRDAQTFDREMGRRLQLGPALAAELDRQTMTLADYVAGPWRAHAATLAPKTRKKYAWVLDNHLGPLGDEPLVTLDVARLTEHQRALLDAGVRPNTVREVFAQIAGILQIAVEHGHIPANPARSMRKVPRDPRPPVVAFEPVELEALIAAASGQDRAMIVLGGYLGLRPIEIRTVPWARLRGDRFTIAKVDTKPSASSRTITVPAAAQSALREWRLEAGRPGDSSPIIGLGPRELNYWNVRLRGIVRDVLGREGGRLTAYTLRHSHASALHYAGYTVPRAAERMGHSQVEHLATYAHVIDGLGDQRWRDLDALIAAARSADVPPMFRNTAAETRIPRK